MNEQKLKVKMNCKSCSGTGIYVGFAEREGVGVNCSTCKGKGFVDYTFNWVDFTGKVKRDDIKIVIEKNFGIVIGLSNAVGLNYQDWFNGKQFNKSTQDRKNTCPGHYYQSVDYDKKPDWKECLGCGAFSGCEHYPNKHLCWDRSDKELNQLIKAGEYNDLQYNF